MKNKDDLYFSLLTSQGILEEDIHQVLESGAFICLQCLKTFTPKYSSKEAAKQAGDKEGVEQWISHICSTKCWNKLFEV